MLLVIVLIILIFGLLVFTHEFGHFITAKRAGVEVEEFGFGFPPKIIGKSFHGTEYSLNLIPLGGFVRMKGETLQDTAPGTFGATTFWQKTKILFAGVTMNILTAFVLLVLLCLTGLPPVLSGQFSHGHTTYAQPKQVMAIGVDKGSPAANAGMRRGDIILRGDGQTFADTDQLFNFTQKYAGHRVSLIVSHHGHERTITPKLRQPTAKNGFLGVTPLQTYKLRYSLVDSIVTAAGMTVQLAWDTLVAFGGLIAGLFVHGTVSQNVTGPVGIVVLLKAMIDLGVAYILLFVVSIATSLAVVNALPLPALDGGRWALALAQKVTKRSLNQKLETAVHLTGFAVLLLLMAVVTFFDIKRIHGG